MEAAVARTQLGAAAESWAAAGADIAAVVTPAVGRPAWCTAVGADAEAAAGRDMTVDT